jgi:hypothetical protein
MRLAMLPVALAFGISMTGAAEVRGAEKTFVLTGLVDCGVRSEAACPVGDTVTLVTDDVGPRQRVEIDIAWVRNQVGSLDQDDFVCIEVSGANGTYQALGLVTCTDAPGPKRDRADDAVEEEVEPTCACPANAPAVKREEIRA